MNVFFLCTGNSARSQMAEAFLRRYSGEHFTAHSAGLNPSVMNPYTVRVMDELGYDMSDHYAKSVKEYLGGTNFGYVITVCNKAEANCPSTFPGQPTRLAWSFKDSAAFDGDDAAKLKRISKIMDSKKACIKLKDGLNGEAVGTAVAFAA